MGYSILQINFGKKSFVREKMYRACCFDTTGFGAQALNTCIVFQCKPIIKSIFAMVTPGTAFGRFVTDDNLGFLWGNGMFLEVIIAIKKGIG